MWINGPDLSDEQRAALAARGFSQDQIDSAQWYVTQDEFVSMRHRPRPMPEDGLTDTEKRTARGAVLYLKAQGLDKREARPVWLDEVIGHGADLGRLIEKLS